MPPLLERLFPDIGLPSRPLSSFVLWTLSRLCLYMANADCQTALRQSSMADTNHILQTSLDPAWDTLQAIKTLSSIEPSNVEISEDDIDVLERIHSAGCKLVAFLDQLNPTPTVDPAQITFTIATLRECH
ncbi:hypothetical protein PHLGIDRAFT_262261 [Phlebiopsis gigantea 11061_1 CR5-6]|uniref:Uncharacterized protein n=1 Tax=Phlebiopsis gigantea (strain 11061_1 CR5-6) TaxID=745531 RepID=A0A0C3SFS2_PHLG1|nr:hypothetical protein PHLGIDRAFT_262261 [Phlebiopsis gigantea 11061_1 CR5-6]